MILIVAATTFELAPIQNVLGPVKGIRYCLTGWGPVEMALHLSRILSTAEEPVAGVANFGVGGAFPGSGLNPLDFCLADKEVLGDFGICMAGEIVPFANPALRPATEFLLESDWRRRAEKNLAAHDIPYRLGTFVTVNCASGTTERGRYLQSRHGAVCENMEGAAAARVCAEFALPFLEFRCISNLVEDRDPSRWQLIEACQRLGPVAATLVRGLL